MRSVSKLSPQLRAAFQSQLIRYRAILLKFFLCIFLGGLECVGHSFAYVAHYVCLRDVSIRTQRATVTSMRTTYLATHLPRLGNSPFSLCLHAFLYTVFRIRIHFDPDPAFQAEYRSGLQKGRSLQPSKENNQHLKKLNNFLIFSTFVGHFCSPGSGS